MAEQRTVLGRIRDKIARVTRSPSSSDITTSGRRSISHLPSNSPSASPQPTSTTINVQITTNLPGHGERSRSRSGFMGDTIDTITEAVNPGVVNVVGQDQINVTANIHVHPSNADNTEVLERNTEDIILSHPLFNKLSHVVKASYDALTPALRRACTEKTRTAILEAIGIWASDVTQPKIYWLNGMAGTGKTTITYSFSIFLKNQNFLGATFFCSRLVDECTKVDRIFPTIAYNLARNYPPLASTILKALKNDPDAANRTIKQQFTDLVAKPIREAAAGLGGKPIIIVIDGLDECANQADVRVMLSVIFQHSSELPLKIFITSRPEQLIRVGFNRENPTNYSKLILHDIERDIVNTDIKLYLAERLVEMVEGRSDFQDPGDHWPPEDKVDVLVHQSNRLFIYAKTICDYIGDHGGNILERLNAATLPREKGLGGDTLDTTELDMLYRDILDRAMPSQAKERGRLRRILSAVISIRNPLSAVGLGILLEIDPGVIKSTLSSLHSVISVPQSLGDPVSTFHSSFPDCLTDSNRSRHHFLPSPESHQLLATSCLSLMNSSLKKNICNLTGRPANDSIANETITTHISEGLAYACVYWASHLTSMKKAELPNTDDVRKLLADFLRDHVLHWAECLSLLKQSNVAVESLRMIEGWTLDIYPEVSTLITDARRFVMENFDLVCHNCLEVYHSALVWLPVQSTIRKRNTTQKPNLPKVLVGLRDAWGPCEKVIISSARFFSVAFSSDGSHIVSGSDDHMVRIWNAATGESEDILEGHSGSVLSVDFSNDGIHIASGSYDKTLRIWNSVTGELERVLEGHSGSVSSVAYSDDGSHVVSGSDDQTVRIWDAATGEPEGVLEGHTRPVKAVAFSSDGIRVVSGSVDKNIRIWDTVTGESERILEGHSDSVWSVAYSSELERVLEGHLRSVFSVAFSSDGSHIVSASYDKTVRIWNTATAELGGIFEGHSRWVSSAAFSRDGVHVVSGSHDGTVRIWNVVTNEPGGVFNGHAGLVSSIAFSSDGSRVVSGSGDKTLRVWSAVTGELEVILEGHSGSVWSVAFSNDGVRVMSGSYDQTVRIWNAVTGESERILEGHSGSVTSVAFSSDGSQIVSGSTDNTVRTWNVVTGELERILRGHSSWVSSVTFSNDGSHIVTVSSDNMVCIWNAVTGNSDGVLDGHSGSVSFDGIHVVSESGENTVIWNVATGESKSLPFARPSNQTGNRYQPKSRFHISTTADDNGTFHPLDSCYLSDDGAWIHTELAQQDCWIPQRYRGYTCHDSCGSKISFGFPSGSVVVVDLSSS